jgi:hypothetical protein
MPSATPALSAALPDRPITVRPPQTIGLGSAIGLFALLFSLLGGALWWLGPDLVRDWRIKGDVVAAGDARLEDARCGTRLFAIKVCEIIFTVRAAGGDQRRTLWYLLIGTAGQEQVALLQARSDPSAVSTDLGLAHLLNRTFTLAAIAAFLVFCIGLSVQVVRQGNENRQTFAALSGRPMKIVIVAIEGSFIAAHKRRRWNYLYGEQGKQMRSSIELATSREPLFTGADRRRALAVIAADGGGAPLLLDAHLSSLDLTEAEKEAFFQVCRRALAEGAFA